MILASNKPDNMAFRFDVATAVSSRVGAALRRDLRVRLSIPIWLILADRIRELSYWEMRGRAGG